jgi:hypothetical protein
VLQGERTDHRRWGNKNSWTARYGASDDDYLIPGTNGATAGKMKGITTLTRHLLRTAYVPVIGAIVLGIIILGERNFFSPQIVYQTEPLSSIGELFY